LDEALQALERRRRESPNDGPLREQLRFARRRHFGFDPEDPIFASSRDTITTSSQGWLPIAGLDIQTELAQRPLQPWLVTLAVCVSDRLILPPQPRAEPYSVLISIIADGLHRGASTARVALEGPEVTPIVVSAVVKRAKVIEAVWRVQGGPIGIVSTRHFLLVPMDPPEGVAPAM